MSHSIHILSIQIDTEHRDSNPWPHGFTSRRLYPLGHFWSFPLCTFIRYFSVVWCYSDLSNWNSWESILSIWNENLDLLWVIHARMNFWSGTWLHMGANCKNSFTSTDLLFLSSALHTHNFFLQSEGSRTAPRRIGAETIRTVKRVGMKLSSSKREEKTSKEITFHLDFFKLV